MCFSLVLALCEERLSEEVLGERALLGGNPSPTLGLPSEVGRHPAYLVKQHTGLSFLCEERGVRTPVPLFSEGWSRALDGGLWLWMDGWNERTFDARQ